MIRSCEWHGTQAVEFTKRDYTALLVPSVGANLVRLAHTRLGVEVLRTPSEREHDEFLRRPHVYGVPILFPPNRIADGGFGSTAANTASRLPVPRRTTTITASSKASRSRCLRPSRRLTRC